ncbi:hypothetical protein TWF718_001234 [Orbilia javanica]|uniref:Uncharacterized protein n=1 Tax=Orbilia javanica TaxID=47235 RepID=A0AAN8RGS5_9PEZI
MCKLTLTVRSLEVLSLAFNAKVIPGRPKFLFESRIWITVDPRWSLSLVGSKMNIPLRNFSKLGKFKAESHP